MRHQYSSSSGVDDKTPARGNNRKVVRITDLLDMYKFKSDTYVPMRLVGPALGVAIHWIEIFKKDGQKIRIPKLCLRYNREVDRFDEDVECPYCDKLDKTYRARQEYYNNAIIRSLQDRLPDDFERTYSKSERKTGFLDFGSEADTPVRTVRLTTGVVTKIQDLRELNRHKIDGKSRPCSVSDENYGCDIMIKFNKDAEAASNAYNIQKGDFSPITEEESRYLHQNIELAIDEYVESLTEDLKTARDEAKVLMTKVVVKKEDGEDPEYSEDDEDMTIKNRNTARAAKSKAAVVEESSDEESSEAPAPKKRGRPAKAAVVEESSDEESSDEESSDEESSDEESSEAPAPKKRGRPAKAAVVEESSDEESSEAPAPKKRGRPAKAAVVAKSSPSAKAKSPARKTR